MSVVVAVNTVENIAKLAITGDMDIAGAPHVRAAARRLIRDSSLDAVHLDLWAITALDDIGVGVLLGLRRLAVIEDRPLVVVAISDTVRCSLDEHDVSRLFP